MLPSLFSVNAVINARKDKAIAEVKAVRLADKRRELEKEMDKWFYGLTTNQQADFAINFWDNMDFEDKKEEYYIK